MGIYIIDLNENSKETADGHIYNVGYFRKFWTQMAIYIYIYMAIPLCNLGCIVLQCNLAEITGNSR